MAIKGSCFDGLDARDDGTAEDPEETFQESMQVNQAEKEDRKRIGNRGDRI